MVLDSQINRKIDRQMYGKVDRQTDRQVNICICRLMNRPNRPKDGETDRLIYMQINGYSHLTWLLTAHTCSGVFPLAFLALQSPQKDRQIDIYVYIAGQMHIQIDQWIVRQISRQFDRLVDRLIDMLIYRWMKRWIDMYIDRQTDKQIMTWQKRRYSRCCTSPLRQH